MDRKDLRAHWLKPLLVIEAYLSFSIVLFFFGPWTWGLPNQWTLAAYLVASQLAIAIGYIQSWRKIKNHRTVGRVLKGERRQVRYLKRAALVTLALLVPTSLSRTGAIFPDIIAGFQNTGLVYNLAFERLQEGNAYVIVEYARIALSPLLIAVFPLTVVFWSRLNLFLRISCCTAIFFNLSLYIATGTNKGLADAVITLPWMIYLGNAAGVLHIKLDKRLTLVFCAALFIPFLYFFGAGQTQREGGVGELGIFNTGNLLLEADRSHPLSLILNDTQRIIFESLARYLGQGYYALGMSFDVTSTSTFGFGNSMFLARNADAIFGTTHFTAGSIPAVLERETGWSAFMLWHSIYPWLASDVGYIGALLVLGGFAYLFGLSWGRALLTTETSWIVLSYMLLILFFYIPANNQIFQSGESCGAFLLVLIGVAIQKRVRARVKMDLVASNARGAT